MYNHHDKRGLPELRHRQEALEDAIWAAAYAQAYGALMAEYKRYKGEHIFPDCGTRDEQRQHANLVDDAATSADAALLGYQKATQP